MIAENVKISIFGNISDNLYSARVSTDGSASTKSAYFVTRKGADEYFDGIVVAVAEFEGLTGERMIVARYGDIYYEPELRRILSKLKNIKLKSIRCLYEKSCGAIIFYKTKQNTKILLVKNNNGRYWSFPKGHIEEGETEQEKSPRASAKSASTARSAKSARGWCSSSPERSPTTSLFRRRKSTATSGLTFSRRVRCAPTTTI